MFCIVRTCFPTVYIKMAFFGPSIVKLQVDMSHPLEKMFSKRFLKYCRNYTSFPKMQGGIAPESFGDSIYVENLRC